VANTELDPDLPPQTPFVENLQLAASEGWIFIRFLVPPYPYIQLSPAQARELGADLQKFADYSEKEQRYGNAKEKAY
jgi:hypothetical protein